MAYVADPTDPTQPTVNALAGDMFLELQALKGYIQTQLSSGSNFVGTGSFRNKLLNGNFNVAQRGQTFAVAAGASSYTVDQWLLGPVRGTTAATFTQTNTNGPFANNNSLSLTQPTGGTGFNLSNRIESTFLQDLAIGGSVTVSGWYKTASLSNASPTIGLQTPTAIDNWTAAATGSTPATAALGVVSPIALNTWVKWKNTFVLATDPTGGLAVVFNWPTTISAGAVSLYNVQLEIGIAASTFELRSPQVELAMCQRFFQENQCYSQGYSIAGVVVGTSGPVLSSMRVVPAATVSTNFSSNINASSIATNILPAGNTITTGTVVADGGYIIDIQFSLSAEL